MNNEALLFAEEDNCLADLVEVWQWVGREGMEEIILLPPKNPKCVRW